MDASTHRPQFILVVDDHHTEKHVREVLKAYWSTAKIRSFQDALDALDALRKDPPHLVVTGFALTRSHAITGPSLAQIAGNHGVPAVILDPTTLKPRPGPSGSQMIPIPQDHHNFDRLLFLAINSLVPPHRISQPPQMLRRGVRPEQTPEPELALPLH